MQKCEFLINDFPAQELTPVTHASCGIRGPGRQWLYGEKETQRNEHAAARKKPPQALCCLLRRGSPEQGLEPVTHTACSIRGPVKQALYGEKERQRGMQVFGLCTDTAAASLAATLRKKEGASSATGSAPSFFR